MIAVAATTPTGSTPGPGTIPGGDPAPAGALNGEEQPTFDHVLAHEAQAENRAPSAPGSADRSVSKGHDLREAGPHRDTATVATAPPNPALFVQLLLTPESRRIAGGSGASAGSTGAPTLEGSTRSNAAVSPKGTLDVKILPDASTGQGPAVPLDASGNAIPITPIALTAPTLAGTAALQDVKSAPSVATIARADSPIQSGTAWSADSSAESDGSLGGKDGDLIERLTNASRDTAPTNPVAHRTTEEVKSTLTGEAALPTRGIELPTTSATPRVGQAVAPPSIDQSQKPANPLTVAALSQIGLAFGQAPPITAGTGAETPGNSPSSAHVSPTTESLADSSFLAHASPIISTTPVAAPSASTAATRMERSGDSPATSGIGNPATNVEPSLPAGKPSVRLSELAAFGAPAGSAPPVSSPDKQRPVDQSAGPTVQSMMPKSEPDQSADKRRVSTTQAAGKGEEPANPSATQPAWVLNPMVTPGQSSTPARAVRGATTAGVAPVAAPSTAADRGRHTDAGEAAPTGASDQASNPAGLSLVQAGPANAQVSSEPRPAHTGSGTDAAVYQPIAQRVLVHGAALHIAGASSSFNVVLNPRSLGMVTVHVARGQEGLQVTITPQQSDTSALLNKHLPDLIGMLRQEGQDLPVQAQVVQTHGATSTHNGTPQAAGAGQSGLNTSMQGGGQAFTGQQENTEQRAWAATAGDLFGPPDRLAMGIGSSPAVGQVRAGSAARIDIQA